MRRVLLVAVSLLLLASPVMAEDSVSIVGGLSGILEEFRTGYANLITGLEQLKTGQAELQAAQTELQTAQSTLSLAQIDLRQGQETLTTGLVVLNEALTVSETELNSLKISFSDYEKATDAQIATLERKNRRQCVIGIIGAGVLGSLTIVSFIGGK